ncbi:MAG: AAA family ATPase, partial [Halanaerobiales bacterium]
QLCLDALRNFRQSELDAADLIVIPSWSPKTEPFKELGLISGLNEKVVVYCNAALYGNSFIAAQVDNRSLDYHMISGGTKPLLPKEEAILVVDIDLDEQHISRGTTKPRSPMKILNYDSLVYMSDDIQREVNNIKDNLKKGDVLDFIDNYKQVISKQYIEKLKILIKGIENTSLRPSDIKYLLSFCPIKDIPPLLKLELDLITYTIEELTKLLIEGKHDDVGNIGKYLGILGKHQKINQSLLPDIYITLSTDKDGEKANYSSTRTSRLQEELGSFQNRGQDLNYIRDFIEDKENRFLSIYGVRGIGKTTLISQAFIKMFPDIDIYKLELSPGSGLTKLLAEMTRILNIKIDKEDLLKVTDELLVKITNKWDELPKACFVIDNWNYLLDFKGNLPDNLLKWLYSFNQSEKEMVNKIILLSEQSTNMPLDIRQKSLTLKGFQDPTYTERLFDYWLRANNIDPSNVNLPPKLIKVLDGHPLAIKIAAELSKYYTPVDILNDVSIYEKFQRSLIDYLFERIHLDEDEENFMKFVSIFRVPVSLDAFRIYAGDDIIIVLKNLIDKFLIELTDNKYKIHPTVRSFFYRKLDKEHKYRYHKMASEYFSRWIEDFHENPSYCAEAFHHAVSSNQLDKMRDLYQLFHTELRPIAQEAYSERSIEKALKLYNLIYKIENDDYDALFHISLCEARLGYWDTSDRHFNKALEMAQNDGRKPWWMMNGYANILINDRQFGEAESMLMQALDLTEKDKDKSSIYNGLAKLRLKQGHTNKAEEFYLKGLEYNDRDIYLLGSFISFLYYEKRYPDAIKYIKKALEISPNNKYINSIYDKLDDKDISG